MKIIVPNTITILNLLSGTISIYMALRMPEKIYLAGYMIILASVFDFLDGFTARLLKAQSDFGKQLDSLSDMISFGLAPAFIMLILLNQSGINNHLVFVAFIIAILSAIRLAIFNITSQTTEFKGLPTPALAIFVASIAIITQHSHNLLNISLVNLYTNKYFLFVSTIILSLLLVSPIKFMALKFKNFSYKNNKKRYFFISLSALLLILMSWQAIPLIILLYPIISQIKIAK